MALETFINAIVHFVENKVVRNQRRGYSSYKKIRVGKRENSINFWVKESGFRSEFFSTYSSPVPNPLKGLQYYWRPLGTLEDGPFEIAANLYTGSKPSWYAAAQTGEKFETMPDLKGFVALLSGINHA